MQLPNNSVVLAAAGSRKTTSIVEDALAQPDKRILVTTYTNENLRNLESCFIRHNGSMPSNVQLVSWFTFLLHDGVRPYQNHAGPETRIESINFLSKERNYNKRPTHKYFFDKTPSIYQDVVADFACECNSRSNGLVIQRIESLYDCIFVDEVQDLSGYDLEFLELLFGSTVTMRMVGDPRQATFATTRSTKNNQFRGCNIAGWFNKMEKAGKLVIETRNECYRCNQAICDFADSIYPEFPPMQSKNTTVTSHDGVFSISREKLKQYVEEFNPTMLRYNKNAKTDGFHAMNFGLSKGQTFERVVIFPTEPMKKFWESRNPNEAGDKAKLYVAVTRAVSSVAFVI